MSIISCLIISCTSNKEIKSQLSLFTAAPNVYSSNGWYTGLTEALEERPESVENHLKLSQYFATIKDWKKSLQFALSALKLDGQSAGALLQTATIYQKIGQVNAAYPLAEKAYQLGYRSLELNLLLAELFISKGKYSSAQYYLNDIIELVPGHNKSFYFKGLIALAEGDSAKAMLNLKKYLFDGPSDVMAYEIVSDMLLMEGKWNESIGIATNGLSKGKSTKLYLTLSKDYFKISQFDSAWNSLNKAIIDSSNVEALGYAGEKYFKLENYVAAIQCFKQEELLSVAPKHTLWIAEAYANIGQSDDAKLYYSHLIESDSSNLVAINALDKLNKRRTIQRRVVLDASKYLPVEDIVADSVQ